jgi:hypothetical protein
LGRCCYKLWFFLRSCRNADMSRVLLSFFVCRLLCLRFNFCQALEIFGFSFRVGEASSFKNFGQALARAVFKCACFCVGNP